MSAATALDRALERFAPDTAAGMRLCTLLDDAADRLAREEAARDAYDVDEPELEESA